MEVQRNVARMAFTLKKPQALTRCGCRVRKLIVYENDPAPVSAAKDTLGLT
jgi:hypothetical protein